MSIHLRASLVPAAAVIPAQVAYFDVVAVKKLVVGWQPSVYRAKGDCLQWEQELCAPWVVRLEVPPSAPLPPSPGRVLSGPENAFLRGVHALALGGLPEGESGKNRGCQRERFSDARDRCGTGFPPFAFLRGGLSSFGECRPYEVVLRDPHQLKRVPPVSKLSAYILKLPMGSDTLSTAGVPSFRGLAWLRPERRGGGVPLGLVSSQCAQARRRLLTFTMNKPERSKQLPFCRLDVLAWHDKGSVLWTNVLALFAGLLWKNIGLSWPSSEKGFTGVSCRGVSRRRLSSGVPHFPLLREGNCPGCAKRGSDLLPWARVAPPSSTEDVVWGQGDDGGRFGAQGTGWRAVKCFDPSQDHQRRKH